MGGYYGALNYYENTGSRSQPDFTARIGAANPLDGIDVGEGSAPTFGDLDGDPDLVVGERDGTLHYYENTGSRSHLDFTARIGAANPLDGIDVGDYSAPTFADLDGDGDLDLVVGESYGVLNYYENTGTGSQPIFTERTGTANPLDGIGRGGINVGDYSTPTFADLDGDGDLDLVVGGGDGVLNYYENTGSRSQPSFTERTGVGNPLAGIDVGFYSTPTFTDLDDDGDPDLVVGEEDGILNYYENTGSRSQPSFTKRFGAANPLPDVDVGDGSTPAFADLDNDGDPDLVVGEWDGTLHHYENTGSRSQPDFTARIGAVKPLGGIDVSDLSTPTFGDLDGDGDPDLVVGEWDGNLNYYENTGSRNNKEHNGDAVAGVDTQYTMSVDDVFRGTLNSTSHEDESLTDTDWIRIELTAGKIYNFSIASLGTTENVWFDLSLLDSSGDKILSMVSGSDGVVDVQRVSATGTYYLKVEGGDADDSLDYEVSVVENTIPEGTYDEIADYLTDGYWEMDWRSRRAFNVEPGGTLTADITTLTPAGQQFARWALEAWTAVTGIGFEFVDGAAHITFDDENVEDVGGYAESNVSDSEILSSYVSVWKDSLPVHATIDSYALHTYLREIGHALGLGHPGPYGGEGVTYSDHAKFLNDSDQATVMSYFSQQENTYIEASYAYPVTPMIADIIAIQNLYGTPTDINLGDNRVWRQQQCGRLPWSALCTLDR